MSKRFSPLHNRLGKDVTFAGRVAKGARIQKDSRVLALLGERGLTASTLRTKPLEL